MADDRGNDPKEYQKKPFRGPDAVPLHKRRGIKLFPEIFPMTDIKPVKFVGNYKQPDYGEDHIKNISQLVAGRSYEVRNDKKELIGYVLIKGIPKEKPFKAYFYPAHLEVCDPYRSVEKNIDPITYGILPDRRNLWSSRFWLKDN